MIATVQFEDGETLDVVPELAGVDGEGLALYAVRVPPGRAVAAMTLDYLPARTAVEVVVEEGP